MSRMTLKKLAQIVGISVSSVSKALNDSYEISDETKRKVLDAAEKYNYRPNILAKSLKTGRTNTIGFIIPYLGNQFQSQIFQGAHQAAYINNYKLVLMQSRENASLEEESMYALLNQNVDGIVICPSANSNTTFLEEFNQNVPIVLIDRIDFDIKTHKVGVDSETGSYNATQHLIDIGRKDILVLCGQNIGVTQKRLSGYKKALLVNGLDYNSSYVIHVDYGQSLTDMITNLKDTLKSKLTKFNHPIGILGTTDTLTVSVLGILSDLQLKVPQDVAVIGFANTEMANSLNPSLSTIVQPAVEMGYKGVEKLLQLISLTNRSHRDFDTIKLDPIIVLRASTKV